MLYDFPRKKSFKKRREYKEKKNRPVFIACRDVLHIYFRLEFLFWVMKNSHTVCIIYLGTLFDSKIKAEHV